LFTHCSTTQLLGDGESDKPALIVSFSPVFTVHFNTAIIEKAQGVATYNNKDFLEALVKCYELYIQYRKQMDDSIYVKY